MWDDNEVDDQENPRGCPFCGNFGCEHLLISIEETFRFADAGPLKDAFNEKWSEITEAGGDDLDEYLPWQELVEDCEHFGYRDEYYSDDGPGTATGNLDIYCPTQQHVAKAVAELSAQWFPNRESPV